MARSIVFGANGYLGRHLVKALIEANFDVDAYGIEAESADNIPNYKYLDCVDIAALEKIDLQVDLIFIFAGMTGTFSGFEDYQRFLQVNDLVLLNILNAVRKSNSKARLVFPSTRLVYKGVENTPLIETDEKEAKTIYAQNKLSCESYLHMFSDIFNINYTIFRICVPYGNLLSNDYSYGTIGFFLKKAQLGENITLYGNGQLKRSFTHVGDIVALMLSAVRHKGSIGQIYNIGSEDNLSLKDVALMIADKYNLRLNFIDWPAEALAIESGDTIFDDSKLKSLIDVKYRYNLTSWVNSLD